MRRINRTYGKGKDLLIIEKFRWSRPHGEGYLTAEPLHELDRIKLHRKSFAVKKSVAVMEFA